MENQKQQQEQGQKAPTTYTDAEIAQAADALAWDCISRGAFTQGERWLGPRQLRWIASGLLDCQTSDEALTWLAGVVSHYGIELRGPLVGTLLTEDRHPERLRQIALCVRRVHGG